MYRLTAVAIALAASAFAPTHAAEAPDGSQPALFKPGLISTGFDDAHVTFAPDGSSLYFIRNMPDFMHWTILESRFRSGHWRHPEVAPFSGVWSDADVFISEDGNRMFFVSNRPADGHPKDDTDIWTMRRSGSAWGAPQHVDELASPGYEWYPTMTKSGVLYFGSERDGGFGASDLWRAKWLGDRFAPPENLGPSFNTADEEIEPLVAPDESWLIFAARGRRSSAGSYDLYISYNCRGQWTQPAPLGGGVNSAGWDFGPRFSPDGRRFFFTSNRAETSRPFETRVDARALERLLSTPRNGLRDIYSVATTALAIRAECK